MALLHFIFYFMFHVTFRPYYISELMSHSKLSFVYFSRRVAFCFIFLYIFSGLRSTCGLFSLLNGYELTFEGLC